MQDVSLDLREHIYDGSERLLPVVGSRLVLDMHAAGSCLLMDCTVPSAFVPCLARVIDAWQGPDHCHSQSSLLWPT